MYADRLRMMGRMEVWAGDPNAGYASGLRLAPGELAPSYLQWALGFARTAVVGDGIFAFNAGEFVPTRRYVAGIVTLLPLIVLHKVRGGRIVWLGAGVRGIRRGFTWPFAIIARLSDQLMWRDERSSQLMGCGGLMPDWAFASGEEILSVETGGRAEGSPRQRLAVALRGDRPPPSDRWIRSVRSTAARFELEIVVVVQVARDHVTSESLAQRLGARLHPWATDDHWKQEQSVRDEYRESRIVLSDRLHALVMGATEGAIPLGWCESTSDKIARHFDVIDASWVSPGPTDPSESLDGLDEARLMRLGVASANAIATARSDIDKVALQLVRHAEVGA
ncbi:polysaccharide pyruvyl transferase family protein [Agromyces sp. Marseille-Q5079]|uniref:polysaccharide pyruvyl transferase family protein n=1 Tax=Agromyces sp. Marseille-Q5079 TaxID=3439059 RepID=UPI003D9C98CE